MIIVKKKKYEHGGYHEPPDGFTLEDYIRQMYAESRFVKDAGSPVGAAGLAQIMPSTRKYMIQRYNLPETVDVYNPQDARTMQRKYMEDLYGRSWNQGTDENKKLKALAAYNYGPTNVIRALEKAKKQGYDIYDDTSWTKDPKVLPKETRDYLDRTYFATDTAFEKEYSSARPKYFDLFPEDLAQKEAPSESYPAPIQKIDPKLQDALDMMSEPQKNPALDPELKQAFKIMGFKGYKDGGVAVKKYQHGGSHPTKEEKRQQMLDSGMWTEGPNGELLRVSQAKQAQDMFGFPTTERARELSQSSQPLNEQELREYISYGFSPTNPVNTAFSMAAGASPAGQAVDVLGNVIGKGLGYVAKGGKQVMNFLRPKADETAEILESVVQQSGYGPFRPKVSRDEIAGANRAQMQEGLDVSNRVMSERLSEHLNPEGQRRARQMIVDQLNEFNKYSEQDLVSMGLTTKDAQGLKRRLSLVELDAAGNVIPNQTRVDDALEGFNQQLRNTKNSSEGVIQRVEDLDKNIEKQMRMGEEYTKAVDEGDYSRAEELGDIIDGLKEEHYHMSSLMNHRATGDQRGAYYMPGSYLPHIKLSREFLLNPQSVPAPTVHEFQHALAEVPAFNNHSFAEAFGRTVPTDRDLRKLKLIDPRNPSIKTSDQDNLWDDLIYFRGNPVERTPFLAEMREDMLQKGFINNRQQEVSEGLMDTYLDDYFKNRDLLAPSTDAGVEGVRILEIMDPNTGAYNRDILKEAVNKMLIGVPAVGAGAAALSNGGSEFGKGGQFKVRKHKAGGYMVRKN